METGGLTREGQYQEVVRGEACGKECCGGGSDQLASAGEGRYAQLGPNLRRGKAKGAGVGREVVKSKVGQVSSEQRSYQFGSEMELHLSHILHPSLHHSSTHLLTHDVSSRLQPPISHPSDPNSSICSSALRVCPLCQVPYHMPGVWTSYLCPSLKELTPRKESLENNSQQCGRLKGADEYSSRGTWRKATCHGLGDQEGDP